MSASFVIGHRMNLVYNYRLHVMQMFAAPFRSKKDVERLRRCHQDVWGIAQHRRTFSRQRVPGTHSGTDLHRKIPALQCQLLNLSKRFVKILLDVVREGLQR